MEREKGWSGRTKPQDAEATLNRFIRERGFGYRIEGGRVMRIDSTFVHEEVVRPALQILMAPGFDGPEEEWNCLEKVDGLLSGSRRGSGLGLVVGRADVAEARV